MYNIFLFFFLFLMTNSFAQELLLRDTTFNVNSIKLHYREYLEIKSRSEFGYDTTLVRIDIFDHNYFPLQVINLQIYALGSPLDTKDPFNVLADSGITLDYNFDGFEDLALRFGNAPNNLAMNGYFFIYIFNPETKQFDKYERELTNPLPVPDQKRVDCTSVYSNFNPHTLTELYEWVNDKLIITESIEYQQLSEQPEKNVILTKEIRTFYQDGNKIKEEEKILRDMFN